MNECVNIFLRGAENPKNKKVETKCFDLFIFWFDFYCVLVIIGNKIFVADLALNADDTGRIAENDAFSDDR